MGRGRSKIKPWPTHWGIVKQVLPRHPSLDRNFGSLYLCPPHSKDVSCSGKFIALLKALLCTWLWSWRNEWLFSDLILLPRGKGWRGIWVEDFHVYNTYEKTGTYSEVSRIVIMSNIHEAVIYWILHVYPGEEKH